VMDKVFRIAMLYDRDEAAAALGSGVRKAAGAVRAAELPVDPNVATTFLHAMSVRLLNYVIKIAVGFKRPCFAPEREIRLLLLNEANILAPLCAVASNGKRYIRYDSHHLYARRACCMKLPLVHAHRSTLRRGSRSSW
jgi:hypothetical protein